MESLIMFIQDNKKKVITIIIVLAILIFIVILLNKEKEVLSEENYAPVVEMSPDEIEIQKDLELKGGDPWALPNENLISNEEIITEVHAN